MAKTGELDQELLTALKAAKTRAMYFAVIMKGASDGQLIVSKKKIPPKDIAEAKKEAGGGKIFKGKLTVQDGQYIFETAKEPPATLANCLKKLAKAQAGLMIKPICQKGTDPEFIEPEEESNESESNEFGMNGNNSNDAPSNVNVANQADENEADENEAEEQAANDGNSNVATQVNEEQEQEETEAYEDIPEPVITTPFSNVQYTKSRLSWDAAKKKVHADMVSLRKAISAELPDEDDLGANLVAEVDKMLEEFDSELDDALDAALNADPNARPAKYKQVLVTISNYRKMLTSDPMIQKIENCPAMPMNVVGTIDAALKGIASHLGG